jgi:hypothetical protein
MTVEEPKKRLNKLELVKKHAGRITGLFEDYLIYDITDREWIRVQNKLEKIILEITGGTE